MFKLHWLADTLREAGLKVIEVDGWKTRGRADMGNPRGVLCHHTAGPRTGNAPSLNLVLKGRADLPGPLSQLFLARDGTFHVLAAGRCNHAGVGSWHGVTAGNSDLIGIEAENVGTGAEPWPAEQMDAYVRGVAAILSHLGEDSLMAIGHKEFATPRGRKIDPAFDMADFRENVGRVMAGELEPVPVAPVPPARVMLRKGDRGKSVELLQVRLGIRADGNFGPATEQAVKAFQAGKGLAADGLVGPKTWSALGV